MTGSCGYYILHRSLYYKRLAARKGGATLDAASTTRTARAFPKRCLDNRLSSLHAPFSAFRFHACRAILHAPGYYASLRSRLRVIAYVPGYIFGYARQQRGTLCRDALVPGSGRSSAIDAESVAWIGIIKRRIEARARVSEFATGNPY